MHPNCAAQAICIRWRLPEGHAVLGAVVCTRIDSAAPFNHCLQPDHRWRVKIDAPTCQQRRVVTTSQSSMLWTGTGIVHFAMRYTSHRQFSVVQTCSRLREQCKAAVGAVMQGGDEQPPLSLCHAVLSPLHLCTMSEQPSGWHQCHCTLCPSACTFPTSYHAQGTCAMCAQAYNRHTFTACLSSRPAKMLPGGERKPGLPCRYAENSSWPRTTCRGHCCGCDHPAAWPLQLLRQVPTVRSTSSMTVALHHRVVQLWCSHILHVPHPVCACQQLGRRHATRARAAWGRVTGTAVPRGASGARAQPPLRPRHRRRPSSSAWWPATASIRRHRTAQSWTASVKMRRQLVDEFLVQQRHLRQWVGVLRCKSADNCLWLERTNVLLLVLRLCSR